MQAPSSDHLARLNIKLHPYMPCPPGNELRPKQPSVVASNSRRRWLVGDRIPAMTTTTGSPAASARRPSRYESQKRRDWHTFTRYLCAHRPPLQLCRCSGAHVLEFLRYLDRFGKTRVHAPPCPAYGGGCAQRQAEPTCLCPLRQAWGSLDALVGRLRAAYDERHGGRGGTAAGDEGGNNPFAARAVRLYLRDVRDAQSMARGISYTRKKKKRISKQGSSSSSASASSKVDAVQQCAGTHVNHAAALMATVAAAPELRHHPYPPPAPAYLNGVPLECCDFRSGSSVVGEGPSSASGGPAGCYGTFYPPPLLFNTFGQ